MPILHNSIKEYLDEDQKKDLLRFLTAGSVDDGKSTLIGRLMYDTRALYADHLLSLKKESKRHGFLNGEIDFSFVTDGLKDERDLGITIDVAYRYFSTNKRKFIIADTPGHYRYTRNMITGASTANLAVLLVDATRGICSQTKRHAYLVSLIGIRHIILAVNKMDLVAYDEKVYKSICHDFDRIIEDLHIPDVQYVPISALKGENVVQSTEKMAWYKGNSLLGYLETVPVRDNKNYHDLRMPVQYIINEADKLKYYCLSIASGTIEKGDNLLVLPGKEPVKIDAIIRNNSEQEFAFAGQTVALKLGNSIELERGSLLVDPGSLPESGTAFWSTMVWLDDLPLREGVSYLFKHLSTVCKTSKIEVDQRLDINKLEMQKADSFGLNDIGLVKVCTNRQLFFDLYKNNRTTGAFILIDPESYNTCAVGMICGTV
ncbi:MAG: GTP-binding protein [Marinilabiliaceae bacterium]|jgi:sulfate adenylyltransferase large subunit|nr:GTP-binding protein [Marinilabiliaceae bacterium]